MRSLVFTSSAENKRPILRCIKARYGTDSLGNYGPQTLANVSRRVKSDMKRRETFANVCASQHGFVFIWTQWCSRYILWLLWQPQFQVREFTKSSIWVSGHIWGRWNQLDRDTHTWVVLGPCPMTHVGPDHRVHTWQFSWYKRRRREGGAYLDVLPQRGPKALERKEKYFDYFGSIFAFNSLGVQNCLW